MKPITRDTLTGLTAIASVVALIAMLVVFGELSKLGKTYYRFTINLPSARGLTGTTPVTLNGVRVGELTGLTNAPNPADGVVLTVEVEDTITIPSDFSVWIERGLISGASIELVVPPGSIAPPVVDGDVYDRETSSFFDELADKMEEPLRQLGEVSEQIATLVGTYDELGRSLNESIDVVMAEDGLRASLEDRLDEASALMEELRAAAADMREIGANVDQRLDDAGGVLVSVNETVASIGEAAQEFRELTAKINNGEGTAGQLATNPDLYRNLTSATERLDTLLTEAQLLIEKIKAEGVGVHF